MFYPGIDIEIKLEANPFDSMILFQHKDNKLKTSHFDNKFIKSYDYIIFSGGGIIETIQQEIRNYFSILKNITIPVLGICFGHQLIGLCFGAKVYYLNNKISGNEAVETITQNLLTGNNSTIQTFNKNHSEAITLPKEFEKLATSSTCTVEMMKHKTKPIYGTQFHPEVSGKQGELIIKNFLNLPVIKNKWF